MKPIYFEDFKHTFSPSGSGSFWYSWKGDGVEICLEPCINGFDVAVYDLNMNLLEPKHCLNLTPPFAQETALVMALIKANKYRIKYGDKGKLRLYQEPEKEPLDI